MANGQWEHFPHEADMGVRGFGRSKEEAFEQAAVALTAVISDPESIEAKEMVEIACEGPDDELLLVNWLNAVVYEMATRQMLFGRFRVALDGTALRGQAWGEAIDVDRHDPAVEVKGATCTSLKVAQDDAGRWFAQCVVDV
jgi:tRNA nucleotidyltransferase (CCA-adding enzyme)